MRPLRIALPWLGAALLLGLALGRADLRAAGQAVAAADWGRYALAAGAFGIGWLVLDSVILARLVTRFHRPVGVRELLPLRGATYLLLVLSYDAAQAALALGLHRRHGIPLGALGGTFLFYYLVDVLTIATLASGGALLVGGALQGSLRTVLGAAAGAALLLLIGLAALSRRRARLPAWLQRSRVLETLGRVRGRDAAEWMGWRALFYGSFVGFAAVTMPAFGLAVPLGVLVPCVPVVMSLAALPISVSGLGSTQLAMLTLYGAHAEPSALLAYSLVYTATLVVVRLPIGLACLPLASDALRRRGACAA
jgi:hypothetical protein